MRIESWSCVRRGVFIVMWESWMRESLDIGSTRLGSRRTGQKVHCQRFFLGDFPAVELVYDHVLCYPTSVVTGPEDMLQLIVRKTGMLHHPRIHRLSLYLSKADNDAVIKPRESGLRSRRRITTQECPITLEPQGVSTIMRVRLQVGTSMLSVYKSSSPRSCGTGALHSYLHKAYSAYVV